MSRGRAAADRVRGRLRPWSPIRATRGMRYGTVRVVACLDGAPRASFSGAFVWYEDFTREITNPADAPRNLKLSAHKKTPLKASRRIAEY